MRIIMILLLLGLFTQVQATEEKKIYKYTDENGVTHYTDTKPSEDFKEADLPELSVLPSLSTGKKISRRTFDDEEQDPSQVKEFTLLKPSMEQNLWGTGGKLTAQVSALTEAQNSMYQVQFVIDGKKQKPADGTTQVFDDIYRGEHTVQGLLINRYSQKVLRKTDKVTFFMHQNSKK